MKKKILNFPRFHKAHEITDSVLADVAEGKVSALNESFVDAGFKKYKPVKLFIGYEEDRKIYGVESRGTPEELIIEYAKRVNDGDDYLKLFATQDEAMV